MARRTLRPEVHRDRTIVGDTVVFFGHMFGSLTPGSRAVITSYRGVREVLSVESEVVSSVLKKKVKQH